MRTWLLVLPLLIAASCSRSPEQAPPSVSQQYEALQDSLAGSLPGASVDRLSIFLTRNEQFSIADTVRAEIERIKSAASGRYREARELARQGDFDHAEQLLIDLAHHLSDTPDGQSAARHLEFAFYFGKIQWLMTRQRFAEAEQEARYLRDRPLTPAQADQVEAILDNLGIVDGAMSLAARHQAQNACKHLSVLLAQYFVEEGRYPRHFTLDTLDEWGGYDAGYIRDALSAIEDYRADDLSCSFVGVSKDGRYRIRVEDGRIFDN